MTIRSTFAIFVGKLTQKLLKLTGRTGFSYPGKLALSIDPNILSVLAKDYDVVMITGTNGKTLTTAMTSQILKQEYPHLLTNSTGSNMSQGIVSAFLSHRKYKNEKPVAVLEVDEAYLVHLVPFLKPKTIVTTNLFRDQMDRFGEIYSVYQKILDGIIQSPDTIVISNGDAPIFHSATLPNKQMFFGFDNQKDQDIKAHYNTDNVLCPHCDKILHYRFISYANLGKYFCPNCSFKRPLLDYKITSIDEMTLDYSAFHIDGHSFKINIAGMYNIYNALAAYSVARVFNISTENIRQGFTNSQRVFGRQEIIAVNNKEVLINLIKNPVGLNQVLDLLQLSKTECSLIAILNDNYADGRDVSWIWDAQFEKLNGLDIKQVSISGTRGEEMKLRLEVAGLDNTDMHVYDDISELIDVIKNSPTTNVYILATYTAMLQLRKELAKQNYIKGEMS